MLQGVPSNYETDELQTLVDAIRVRVSVCVSVLHALGLVGLLMHRVSLSLWLCWRGGGGVLLLRLG